VTVNDTPEQTKAVLLGIADTDDDEDEDFDLDAWHALQRWLELGDCRVTIPYRRKLPSWSRRPRCGSGGTSRPCSR
jgi:hypothetical protein